MKQPKQSNPDPVRVLRKAALSFPEVEEGISCDKAAFKARGKAFLFVGRGPESYNVMLKLGESLPEAAALAAKEPDCCKVGGTHWVTVTLPIGRSPPAGLLERWITESYRLLAPKALVAKLPAADGKRLASKKPAKKRATS
jgi:hypothetical protein